MKKGLLVLFVFILGISLISNVIAVEVPQWNDKYVNDFAGILDKTQGSDLRGLFSSIDQETTAEMVFVSDKECASHGGPSQYAIDLLNTWKVGKADKNNGLVILYCKEENKIWVSTGYGLEGILPDSKVGRLLDENYVPLRDSGNVQQGIIDFSKVTAGVIVDNKDEVISGKAGAKKSIDWVSVIIIIIWIFLIVRVIFAKFWKNKKNAPWWIPIFLPSGGGYGGGGFGGGGFGGGGGGGGGAGR